MQRSITSDCTVEKLGTMLDENPRGIGLLRDEITAWLRSMDQYRAQKKGTDAQFFLSAWSDEAVIIDRVSSPSRMVWQSVGASKARVDNRYLSDPGRPPSTLPASRSEPPIRRGRRRRQWEFGGSRRPWSPGGAGVSTEARRGYPAGTLRQRTAVPSGGVRRVGPGRGRGVPAVGGRGGAGEPRLAGPDD